MKIETDIYFGGALATGKWTLDWSLSTGLKRNWPLKNSDVKNVKM
jgi:hypothetical protein